MKKPSSHRRPELFPPPPPALPPGARRVKITFSVQLKEAELRLPYAPWPAALQELTLLPLCVIAQVARPPAGTTVTTAPKVPDLLGGPRTLAVDDGRRGSSRTADPLAAEAAQPIVDPSPDPLQAPEAEVVMDRLPRWEVLGQQSPGAAGPQQVEESVEDFAAGVFAGPATTLFGW